MFSRMILVFAFCATATAQQFPGDREAAEKARQSEVNTHIQAAEAALEKGDLQNALATLKALAADQPKNALVLYDLGYAQERTGDETAATQSYASAIAADSTMAEPLVALGLLDARANRNDKAHTELENASKITTASPELQARALRALAALDETTQPDAARDELMQAIKLTGETPADVQMGAEMAAHAGSAPDAEQAYRRALTLDPKNAEAASQLAHILEQENKADEAETVLQKALEANPGDAVLISGLAAVYGEDHKPQQGIDLLVQARTADPKFGVSEASTRMLARLDAMADKNDDAAKLFSGLVAANPNDPMLLDEYGGVLVKLDRNAEAEAVFSKAIAMRAAFPTPQDWAESAGHLAFAASRNHDPKVTLQALASRATVLPNSPASMFLEAIAHDTLHETKDAVKAYRAFLTVANGKFPDQEFQARHRLVALDHQR